MELRLLKVINMFERKQPKVSIVIPSWFAEKQNGKYGENETFVIANECLKRLLAITTRHLYELIIIDNGSTLFTDIGLDDFSDMSNLDLMLRYWDKADIIIRNRENLGFAPAINQGINMARGELVIAVNNDILFWEGWLDQMLKDFEEVEKLDPKAGLLMPALYKEKKRFWDILKLKKDEVDMTVNAGKWGPGAEFGSCWMGRRSVLMEAAKNRDGYQVMDENFFLGMGEDRWLYREIRMMGLETYRTHNLRVAHVGNLTIGKFPNRKKYTEKNREYLQELKDKHNIK